MRKQALSVALVLTGLATSASGDFGSVPILLAPTDGIAGQRVGESVDLFDGRGVVGVTADSEVCVDATLCGFSGAAYVFNVYDQTQVNRLTPVAPTLADEFGATVVIDDSLIAVGSPGHSNTIERAGTVFLYDSETLEFTRSLVPEDGAYGDLFGSSIALSEDYVLVGAHEADPAGDESGTAYLFDRDTGEQLLKLAPEDANPGDEFGHSVALSGGFAVVGAHLHDGNGSSAGKAYVFDVATGEELFQLEPNDATASQRFGVTAAVDGRYAAIGAWDDDEEARDAGAVYVFDLLTGNEIDKLVADDASEDDGLGLSLDFDDGLIVAGAIIEGSFVAEDDTHAAYVFDFATGEQVAKLFPPEADRFQSWSVAIDEVVFAGFFEGSAHGYYPASLDGDFTNDGQTDQADYTQWLSDYGVSGLAGSDANGDGAVNAIDYALWRDAASRFSNRVAVPEPRTLLFALLVAFMRTISPPRCIG
ncbi:MAG: hypothetical protein AAF266_10260 [Planctomycetota bacterium]